MLAAEEKRFLREGLLAKRLHLKATQVDSLSKKIIKRLINNIEWEETSNIHLYVPIKKNNEVDTWPLIKFIRETYPEIEIYNPKGNGFVLYDPKVAFKSNGFGVPEPTEGKILTKKKFDVVVAPILGFDLQGYRLGYGGGYYDKTLAHNKFKHVIGIAYDFAEIENFPPEKHDQKMHKIITEKRIITIKS